MAEKKQFKAESKRLLDLMINSIYTHKEIFLRELISNASDASDKLYYKALTENISSINRNDLKIMIEIDKENRVLTIKDNGIGMDKDELETHLGTIANSGSFEFKNENEKLQDENEELKEQIQQLLQKETSRKALETENIKLRALIKSSVYPEIANELLKEEGILQSEQQVITDEFMANNILTADSEINFHSNITNSKDDKGDIRKPKKVVAIKDLLDSKTNY